jgi:N-methylhydantoinase A
MNVRVAIIGQRPPFDMARLKPEGGSLEAAERGARKVYADGAWHDARIFARLLLPAGARIDGPAVLEQPDATIFVDPGLKATVDALGNVLVNAAP